MARSLAPRRAAPLSRKTCSRRFAWALGLLLGMPAAAFAEPGRAALEALAEGKLVGTAPYAGSGMRGAFAPGLTLTVDPGVALPVRVGWQTGWASLAAGAAIGYQFSNGLDAFLRFDVLGVSQTLIDYSDLRVFGAGARYSIAFLVPTPFFEVMVGPAIVVRRTLPEIVTSPGVAGAVGAGATLPLGRSFSIGVVGRYWLADGPSGALQTVTVQATLTATFGVLFRT